MKRFRFYSYITIALILVFQISCASTSVATDEVKPAGPKVNVGETIQMADASFAKRDESIDNIREAVKLLKTARDPENRNYEVEWKNAYFNYFLGKRTDKEKESEKAFEEGIAAGKIALRIEPNRPEGHFWYAANLGEKSKRSPVTVGLTNIDDIREAMNRVIEIQPDYQSASAYNALAEIELATGLFGGTPEKAIAYLEKALQIEDDNTYIHLHLGKAYLAVSRDAEAKKRLEHLIGMKPAPGFQFEYDECITAGKKLLQSRF